MYVHKFGRNLFFFYILCEFSFIATNECSWYALLNFHQTRKLQNWTKPQTDLQEDGIQFVSTVIGIWEKKGSWYFGSVHNLILARRTLCRISYLRLIRLLVEWIHLGIFSCRLNSHNAQVQCFEISTGVGKTRYFRTTWSQSSTF